MREFRQFRKSFKENGHAFLKELQRLFTEKSFEELFRYYLFISEQIDQQNSSCPLALEALTNEISEFTAKSLSKKSINEQSRRLIVFTRLNTKLVKKLILSIDRKNFDPVLVILNKNAESKILQNELEALHIPCRLEEYKLDLHKQIEFLQSIIQEEQAGNILTITNQADLDLKTVSKLYQNNCIDIISDVSCESNKDLNLRKFKKHFWNSNEGIPDFRRVSVYECWSDTELPEEVIAYSKTVEQLCLFTYKPLELFKELSEEQIKNFSFTSNPSEVETIMQSCKEVLATNENFEKAISTARKYGCDLKNLSTDKKFLYESLIDKFNASRKFKVELNEITGKLSRKKRKTPRLIHFRYDYSAPIIKHISQDISNALGNLGIDSLDIDLSELHQANHLKNDSAIAEARKSIMKKIKQFKPDQAVGYNAFGIFPSGESHLLEKLDIPYNGLFFDNPFYSKSILKNTPNKEMVRIFTLDRELIPLLKSCGFNSSHYLPIATSAQRFSMKKQSQVPKTQLLFTATVKPKLNVDDLAKECSNPEDAEFIKFAHPEILKGNINFQSLLKKFNTEAKNKDYPKDFYSFIETWFKLDLQCTTHFRLKTVETLKDYNMHIYGGSFWKNYELTPKHSYLNFLDYKDLPQISRSAELTLCSTPVNIQDGIQQRILDCGALQSPVLADYRPVLEEHFKLDKELYVYKSFEELEDKTAFLLKNPGLRRKASLKLYENVMQNHTWERRMEEFLDMI